MLDQLPVHGIGLRHRGILWDREVLGVQPHHAGSILGIAWVSHPILDYMRDCLQTTDTIRPAIVIDGAGNFGNNGAHGCLCWTEDIRQGEMWAAETSERHLRRKVTA